MYKILNVNLTSQNWNLKKITHDSYNVCLKKEQLTKKKIKLDSASPCRYNTNSQGADEIKDFPILIDFRAQKHGVVTSV